LLYGKDIKERSNFENEGMYGYGSNGNWEAENKRNEAMR